MKADQPVATQQGAITWWVAIGLVILASLTSLFSLRSAVMDQLANANHDHASQARWAAEAALARAQDLLVPKHSMPALLTGGGTCPEGVKGSQWECSPLAVPQHPGLPQVQLSATAVRDVVHAPHRLVLHAYAHNPGQHSRAQVRESVFIPTLTPAPPMPTTSALVLNGCVSEAAGAALRVCNGDPLGANCAQASGQAAVWSHFAQDTNGDGRIDPSEKSTCLGLKPGSSAPGDAVSAPDQVSARSPCNRAAWRSVLGDISEGQLREWSTAQERRGLNAHSDPPRTIYWVDQAKAWSESVGTETHPVLLVFSAQACAQRCPQIGLQARVIGTVVLDSGCQDEKLRGWSAGRIQGQLVVESGIPAWQAATVVGAPFVRQTYAVQWPLGIDWTQAQRIHGTWSEGTP